jgi:Fe-S-cluster containining protein
MDPTTEIDSANVSAASRLCSACGMCCNGVMFHTVAMQPADSATTLSALGLKLKRKKGKSYILQPCPAFRGTHCGIYTARPERCRLFECRQLKRVATGEISEADALEKIQEATRRVAEVTALLEQAGGANPKRPLSKRCETALAVPLHHASDPITVELHRELTRAMRELDALLDADFRIGAHEPLVIPAAS